jgi:hypothetical protein
MNNLAVTYRFLGRHADALAVFERLLESYRRVVPENHPSISERRLWSDALHLLY